MKKLLNKDWIIYVLYVVVALVGIWFLTKTWMPAGYVVAGHDSGLALNAESFLKTRFFAWDDRIDFGADNSPHFGSIMLHLIDRILSIFAPGLFAGTRFAVFFWLGILFIFSSVFSYSLKQKLGRLVPYFFPVFLTFNFFIFQSIFILERAKYEIVCVILLFLTFALKILFDKTKSILGNSIIFSLVFSVFNGGSWLGLPLYGGLFVTGLVYLFFAVIMARRERDVSLFKRALIFNILNIAFFVLLNLYSILPFVTTLVSSDYAKVVGTATISAGKEWLVYISRGSFFINLFRLQGVPDWYLTGGLPNPEISYASIYLTNRFLTLISFAFPILAFSGILFAKSKTEKYIISFFAILLLASMFFTSGTNSPLGFIYVFLYERIPGFSIFRSPYFKFASSFIISYSVFLAYSLSKLGEFIYTKANVGFLSRLKVLSFVITPLFVLVVVGSWLSYNFIIFDSNYLFKWQPDKSTLVTVPEYAVEFDQWLKLTNFNGRALIVPAFDGEFGNDNYTWGYWSLSPLPSVLFSNGSFVVNDASNNPVESDIVNKLYVLLLKKDPAFFDYSKKLGIKYFFLREDYLAQDSNLKEEYVRIIKNLADLGSLRLVKNVGPWSLYEIAEDGPDGTFRLVSTFFSIPEDHAYLSKEITIPKYINGDWIVQENTGPLGFKNLVSQEFFPLDCNSCLVENLGRHADYPPVRVLPNSPFYVIKEKRNEKILLNAIDENSKLAAYLGLMMTKLSEVRSMVDLKIDKKYVNRGLNDINSYLLNINKIISTSASLKSDFYFASKIYESVNPVQRYFRDYINNSNFVFEKSETKDSMFKILWQSLLLKKQFDGLVAGNEDWRKDKIYDIDLPSDGQYGFLIDGATLPSDHKGGVIYPSNVKLSTGQSLSFGSNQGGRWMFVGPAELPKTGKLSLTFQNLPDLSHITSKEQVDFPTGTRGCLISKIDNFNKYRNYVLTLSSDAYLPNMRLYIKENSQRYLLTDEFLRGDIEVDVSLNPNGEPFKYFFDPSIGASEPMVYVCRYDGAIPQNVKINVLEIFKPEIYAVKNNAVDVESAQIIYKKIDPTRYQITTEKLSGDMVLVFNQLFNSQWYLMDKSDMSVIHPFKVNGYENGWLLPGGKAYDLSLVYHPQELFEKGLKISASVAIILIIVYLRLTFRINVKNKNEN
ncbi:MAG: hypothetical protein HYV90_02970 [Candidatus Woesebacteria bacterium]|nr:MAG: hypothetical protein HYV90_02970 [Candidatus Woesebacteria bacterium]